MTATEKAAAIAGFRSETALIDGVTLHYWRGGPADGAPVLLLHGFLGTGYVWRDVGPALAAAGCAVLIVDMRGYGDSDKPEGVDGYDARALAKEARALAMAIGFGAGRPIVLAAHDMGALPALLWAADHPGEVAGLLYAEAPVMLGGPLREAFAYTAEATQRGAMWWWILALAPGVPERLIVGNERAFLSWFYDSATVHRDAIDETAIAETLRTFAGREGVLGAMGVYRAAFVSIAQTEALLQGKVTVPAIAMGGVKGLGDKVGAMLRLVASDVDRITMPDAGHFLPEERPVAVAGQILKLVSDSSHSSHSSTHSSNHPRRPS